MDGYANGHQNGDKEHGTEPEMSQGTRKVRFNLNSTNISKGGKNTQNLNFLASCLTKHLINPFMPVAIKKV